MIKRKQIQNRQTTIHKTLFLWFISLWRWFASYNLYV